MSQFIMLRRKLVPSQLDPVELEKEYNQTSYRGEKGKRNQFRTNPLRLIHKLTKTYDIPFKLEKFKDTKQKLVILEIPALEIKITATGPSIRKSLRKLTFKLHKEYTRQIITIKPK